MNTEAIVGIVALAVAIPPTVYTLYKWYDRGKRKASLVETGNTVDYGGAYRPESQTFIFISERHVTFGLRL
ncbi:hypothetical protein NXS19_004222 [Fusarium pseudograminearum]|nr:hypothetical protein NXS19_004222 [Fusarium pseudograminearum]